MECDPRRGREPPTASPEASGSDLPRLIEPEAEAGDQGEAQAADEAPFETLQSALTKWVAIDPPIEEPDDDEPQAMPNPAPAQPSTDAPLAAESLPRAEGVADGEAETGTDDQASEAEGPSTLPGLDPGAEIEELQWLDLTLAKADAVLIGCRRKRRRPRAIPSWRRPCMSRRRGTPERPSGMSANTRSIRNKRQEPRRRRRDIV